MKDQYIAHINEKSGKTQSVFEHSMNVANLCYEMATEPLKELARAIGMLHDIGKYQSKFQERILRANIRVEHSTCGALATFEKYGNNGIGWMMAYCIAGHHGGIPDGGYRNDGSYEPTLNGRMKRKFEDYTEYKNELVLPKIDMEKCNAFLAMDCQNNRDPILDKYAFVTRYLFSCLVDADSLDTADFCRIEEAPRKLGGDFEACLKKTEELLNSFQPKTALQKARAQLQKQVFQNIEQEGDIYLMNMPTGSGKTLASVKAALSLARKGKKRIIYVIPYVGIIDQTVKIFEELFGEDMEILRHQSTFSYEDQEDLKEEYRDAAKVAMENWDAKFVVTTAVQFFESIYSNRRGKLRKLHNMEDSILIFDEAHLMPVDYLQPCLQAVSYFTRYLGSKAIFLTATMPDFRSLIQKYAIPETKIVDLVPDRTSFPKFQKCHFQYIGSQNSDALLKRREEYANALIVVNTRSAARELFEKCEGKKYHLSTYQTPFDREKILNEIRNELKQLKADYPGQQEVPRERRITVVSTSLIEAGVDLDMNVVFRETAGLDSVLQAGGRCNREGEADFGEVLIFDFLKEEGGRANLVSDARRNITKGLLQKYDDISDPMCIEEYYRRVFSMREADIEKNTMHKITEGNLANIPFREYAEKFNLIDQKTVSLIVERDEKSKGLIEKLKYQRIDSRSLQKYACSVYQMELEELLRQGVVGDFESGVYCLLNLDYYDEKTGIQFQGKDYFLE